MRRRSLPVARFALLQIGEIGNNDRCEENPLLGKSRKR
jgi:hypothetical protein